MGGSSGVQSELAEALARVDLAAALKLLEGQRGRIQPRPPPVAARRAGRGDRPGRGEASPRPDPERFREWPGPAVDLHPDGDHGPADGPRRLPRSCDPRCSRPCSRPSPPGSWPIPTREGPGAAAGVVRPARAAGRAERRELRQPARHRHGPAPAAGRPDRPGSGPGLLLVRPGVSPAPRGRPRTAAGHAPGPPALRRPRGAGHALARYDRSAAEDVFGPVAERVPGLVDEMWGLGNEGDAIFRAAAGFDARAALALVDALPEDPVQPPDGTAIGPRLRHKTKAKARLAVARMLGLPPELRLREPLRRTRRRRLAPRTGRRIDRRRPAMRPHPPTIRAGGSPASASRSWLPSRSPGSSRPRRKNSGRLPGSKGTAPRPAPAEGAVDAPRDDAAPVPGRGDGHPVRTGAGRPAGVRIPGDRDRRRQRLGRPAGIAATHGWVLPATDGREAAVRGRLERPGLPGRLRRRAGRPGGRRPRPRGGRRRRPRPTSPRGPGDGRIPAFSGSAASGPTTRGPRST